MVVCRMAEWEAMKQCFCLLWFEQNITPATKNTTRRGTDSQMTNSSAAFNHLCSSLWGSSTSYSPSYANFIEEILYKRVAVSICCFGLIGNAVNLIVLSVQSRHSQSGRMQQFARIGLMALAVADSLFCLSILPHAFVERDPVTTSVNFSVVYSAYGEAVINVFAMIGTWLTVGMATGRYAAVCHPFQARAAIGRTVALRLIAVVCGTCAVFNIPRFFINSIETCPKWSEESAVDNQAVYFRWFGPLHVTQRGDLELGYVWISFLVSVVVPLVVLIFTGCRLTLSLRRSRLDGAGGAEERAAATVDRGRIQDVDRSFTLTLVAVALMHIVLVSPAELVNFSRSQLLQADDTQDGYQVYNLLASVLNTLQAANYSFNFLLYCAVNVAFRRRFLELVSCRGQVEAENQRRLQTLAHCGLLSQHSVDSDVRRSVSQRRMRTPERVVNCHLTVSDFVN